MKSTGKVTRKYIESKKRNYIESTKKVYGILCLIVGKYLQKKGKYAKVNIQPGNY